MEKITSRENAKVKYACRLASSGAFRRAEGRFLAEGRKLCPELCRGAELETLFCTESALEKCPELSELPGEHYLVEDHVADKLPEAIALLREKGITCLAAALYQSQPLSAAASSYPDGVCVVIGSEGQGLTDETIAACTGTVRIPMTDRVESLNAGIAGSILLWHFREESL